MSASTLRAARSSRTTRLFVEPLEDRCTPAGTWSNVPGTSMMQFTGDAQKDVITITDLSVRHLIDSGEGQDIIIVDMTAGPVVQFGRPNLVTALEINSGGGDADILIIKGIDGQDDVIDFGWGERVFGNGIHEWRVNLDSDQVADIGADRLARVEFFGQGGNDTFNGKGNAVVGDPGDTQQVERLNLLLNGGDGNDTLIAPSGSAENHFDGGAGDDLLVGSAWLDHYHFHNPGSQSAVSHMGKDVIQETGSKRLWLYFSSEDGRVMQTTAGITVDLDKTGPQIVNPFLTLTLPGNAYFYNVVGSQYDDVIYGSSADTSATVGDYLYGRDGDDTLYGRAGEDLLSGGEGDDTMFGGTGADLMFGYAGNDYMDGGDGNDIMSGGTEDDCLLGGKGNDNLAGDLGDDQLLGGNDNDELAGGDGEDHLSGEWGNDKLYGGNQDDYLNGGSGTDELYGNDGDDELDGEADSDKIYGGAGEDEIEGRGGNDTLEGGSENDIIHGGDGNDVIRGDAGDDELYGEKGADQIWGGADNDDLYAGDNDSPSAQRNKLYGDEGDDNLRGSNQPDDLVGGAGNDDLYGKGGKDWMNGGDNDDTLDGGTGDDTLLGGSGNDELRGQENNDTLYGEAGDDELQGGTGNDYLSGGDNNDLLLGQEGNDTVRGGDGNDIIHEYNDKANHKNSLWGGAGNDLIVGGDGQDEIDGGDDNDQLFGGQGKDSIYGGNGNDFLHGGRAQVSYVTWQVTSYLDDYDPKKPGKQLVDKLKGNAGTDTFAMSSEEYVFSDYNPFADLLAALEMD